MAKVDVIVPCYRYGRFLRQCVASVLDQDLQDVRVVIIDNASDDDSVDVAQQLVREDPRVELVARERNLGPHASFNEGIDRATGEYLLIHCADDVLAPGALSRATAILDRNPQVTFAIGQEIEFSGDDIPTVDNPPVPEWRLTDGRSFIERLCKAPAKYVAAATAVVRKSVQKQVGHYRPELPYTDDLEMMLRLASTGGVAETSAIQDMRRIHGGNMSTAFLRTRVSDLVEREAAFRSFFAKEGRLLPGTADLQRHLRRGLSEQAYWWGIRELLRGEVGSAANLFRFAFKVRPTTALVPPVEALFRRDRAIGRPAGNLVQRWKGTT